jgi:hypothetical protein
MRLAFDVGFAGLPLGIERVEFKVEIMLGRFAGVDRAALGFSALPAMKENGSVFVAHARASLS